MKSSGIKLIINILILILFVGAVTYLLLNTVEISDYTVRSLEDYEAGIEDLEKAETTYQQALQRETRAKSSLESKIQVFEDEKEKYNNISKETIKTIKDATKIEKYSIEYIWVRLGNYAKKYKVAIGVVEPGNESGLVDPDKENPDGTTPPGEELPGEGLPGEGLPGEGLPGEGLPGEGFPGEELPGEGSGEQGGNSGEGSTNNDGTLLMRVQGTYKNVCDYIYVIENDATLRFKLENMRVMGTDQVSAEFEIKNMQIEL